MLGVELTQRRELLYYTSITSVEIIVLFYSTLMTAPLPVFSAKLIMLSWVLFSFVSKAFWYVWGCTILNNNILYYITLSNSFAQSLRNGSTDSVCPISVMLLSSSWIVHDYWLIRLKFEYTTDKSMTHSTDIWLYTTDKSWSHEHTPRPSKNSRVLVSHTSGTHFSS